jgi:hypothetical protein
VLLRLDPDVYEGIARWASDDLRSVNAQIEYALRRALRAAGRLRSGSDGGDPDEGDQASATTSGRAEPGVSGGEEPPETSRTVAP